jgi:uncharacterized repeat protein (TIGR03943 family)
MTMSVRTQRSLQALILAGLGLFLLHKIWSGTLFWYINDRFLVLVLAAAIGFLALARIVMPKREPGGGPSKTDEHPHEDEGHNHDHGAEGSAGAGWGLVLVATPLVLGLALPARPLGSSAIANRGINTTAPLTAGSAAPVQLDLASTERNVLDWVRAFNYAEDPAEFAGQEADVIGFVYHDDRVADGHFLVSRFAVTCCSADATAIGMLVSWPEAEALEPNTWVRVRGPVAVGTFAGRPIPLVAAAALEGVEPPAQPYLYP